MSELMKKLALLLIKSNTSNEFVPTNAYRYFQ